MEMGQTMKNASSIFITAFTDIIGFLAFLGLATTFFRFLRI